MGLYGTICTILAALAVLLSILDVTSTQKFLSMPELGIVEANYLSAWLQKTFPNAWGDIRIAGGMVVAVIGLHLPAPFSIIILGFACVWWGIVIYNNYRLIYRK